MKLEVGQVYSIVESLGMVMIEGKFLGVAMNSDREEVLVFQKKEGDSGYKFFGAKWHMPYNGAVATESPTCHLRSTHYGNTIETLRPSEVAHQKQHGFKLKS